MVPGLVLQLSDPVSQLFLIFSVMSKLPLEGRESSLVHVCFRGGGLCTGMGYLDLISEPKDGLSVLAFGLPKLCVPELEACKNWSQLQRLV